MAPDAIMRSVKASNTVSAINASRRSRYRRLIKTAKMLTRNPSRLSFRQVKIGWQGCQKAHRHEFRGDEADTQSVIANTGPCARAAEIVFDSETVRTVIRPRLRVIQDKPTGLSRSVACSEDRLIGLAGRGSGYTNR